MWAVAATAEAWSCRPSDLLNVQDDYVAFCVDEMVAYAYGSINAKLDEIDLDRESKKLSRKRQGMLDHLLGVKRSTKGRFKDPFAKTG